MILKGGRVQYSRWSYTILGWLAKISVTLLNVVENAKLAFI